MIKSKKVKVKRKSHLPPGYRAMRPRKHKPLHAWCEIVAERRRALGIETTGDYLTKVASGSTKSVALFQSLWDEPDCPRHLMNDKFGAIPDSEKAQIAA